MSRLLVVNADDFGFTRDVNDGIVEAHRNGILTATTLMANGGAFDHAVALARETPSLDVGCHLVLVGGCSLLPPHRELPRTLKDLIPKVMLGRIDVEAELESQIRKIVDAGIQPTHLDTHKHTHLLPQVLQVVARLSRKYNVRWIRRPFDYPLNAGPVPLTRRMMSLALNGLRGRFHRVLESNGCKTTDHFAGFRLTGYLHTTELLELLRALPEGSTELMTHPGHCGSELMRATTRLKASRQKELEALTDPRTRDILSQSGIQLVRFGQLT